MFLHSMPFIRVSSCPMSGEASTLPSDVFQAINRLKPEEIVPALASNSHLLRFLKTLYTCKKNRTNTTAKLSALDKKIKRRDR